MPVILLPEGFMSREVPSYLYHRRELRNTLSEQLFWVWEELFVGHCVAWVEGTDDLGVRLLFEQRVQVEGVTCNIDQGVSSKIIKCHL